MKRASMTRQRRPFEWLWFVAVLAACNGDDGGDGCNVGENIDLGINQGVVPAGDTPAEAADPVWLVGWDNPVVGGKFDFRDSQFAQRVGTAWEYDRFDLEARVDDPARGFEAQLPSWPEFDGLYGDDEGFFFWESHGVKLTPRVTGEPLEGVKTLTALRDDWDLPELPYKDESLFQLDPDVKVVPIRVVALFPAGAAAPYFSVNRANLVFDDLWRADKDTTTNPGESPHIVVSSWTSHTMVSSGLPIQPDRIFDGCGGGVQFRVVSYDTCEVPRDDYEASANSTFCSPMGQTSSWNGHANGCGVPDDVAIRVIFGGRMVGSTCDPQTIGGQLGNNVFISENGSATSFVLAHEIGHALGLDHPFCAAGDFRLMCDNVAQHGSFLSDEECTDAYTAATNRHDFFW